MPNWGSVCWGQRKGRHVVSILGPIYFRETWSWSKLERDISRTMWTNRAHALKFRRAGAAQVLWHSALKCMEWILNSSGVDVLALQSRIGTFSFIWLLRGRLTCPEASGRNKSAELIYTCRAISSLGSLIVSSFKIAFQIITQSGNRYNCWTRNESVDHKSLFLEILCLFVVIEVEREG